MKVCNEIYYHIGENIDDTWKIGSTLFVNSQTFNKRYDGFFKYSSIIWDNFKYLSDENFYQYIKHMIYEITNSSNPIKENIIKECMFESIRIKKYPNLPSRLTSYWMCEDESLKFWYDVLIKKNAKKKIYKLKVEGNIHKTHHAYIMWPIKNIDNLIKNANDYWSGYYEEKTQSEVLFNDGKITIIDEYNNLEDYSNKH